LRFYRDTIMQPPAPAPEPSEEPKTAT